MAEADYFLKINGIDGESVKDGHTKEIELHSFSWGETNSGSHAAGGTGGGAGKVSMHDFAFKMSVNASSPLLFQACATGKHIPDAMLSVRKAGSKQQDYFKIKMTDLLVSSFQTSGSGAEVIPTELVTFNFAKIEFSYAPQKKDGSVGAFTTKWFDVQQTTSG